jgi:hypothetical protein
MNAVSEAEETVIGFCKVVLELNAEKTKYMLLQDKILT